MSKVSGTDIVIYVDTSSTGTPTWTAVGGQTGAKLHEGNDTVESKGYKLNPDGNAKQFEYNQYEWTISCDGLLIASDTALTALQAACRDQEKVKVRVKQGSTYIQEGMALITSLDLDAPYKDDATYSLELQGTGSLTTTGLT